MFAVKLFCCKYNISYPCVCEYGCYWQQFVIPALLCYSVCRVVSHFSLLKYTIDFWEPVHSFFFVYVRGGAHPKTEQILTVQYTLHLVVWGMLSMHSSVHTLKHLNRILGATITWQNLLYGQVRIKLTPFHTLMIERLLKMNELRNIIQEHLMFAALY